MSRRVYNDSFNSWGDVRESFGQGVPEKEPTSVFAAYTYEDYGCDGQALVLFKQGRKFGWAEGGHCSCYGLEDQWSPTFFPKKALREALKRVTYGLAHQYQTHILEWLEAA